MARKISKLYAIPTERRVKAAGVGKLVELHTWMRPHDSSAERDFARLYLDTVPGMTRDDFGNRMIVVGAPSPDILFSCHIDTVASRGGRQNIRWIDAETIGLNQGKPGQSLGADDSAGVWLCLELIAAKVPGLYIFHRGEECGGLGSSWIVKHTPQRLDGIKAAIAFDRMDTGDIITHQLCGRTCSDAFAKSLAATLNMPGTGLRYRPDDTGTFTDTANYTDLVGECTNLSVGYMCNHGPRETLDVAHLVALRDAMVRYFDARNLTFERLPGEIDYGDFGGYYSGSRFAGRGGGWLMDDDATTPAKRRKAADRKAWGDSAFDDDDDDTRDRGGSSGGYPLAEGDRYSWDPMTHRMRYGEALGGDISDRDDFASMALAVAEHPEAAARLLSDYGVTLWELMEQVWKETGRTPYRPLMS